MLESGNRRLTIWLLDDMVTNWPTESLRGCQQVRRLASHCDKPSVKQKRLLESGDLQTDLGSYTCILWPTVIRYVQNVSVHNGLRCIILPHLTCTSLDIVLHQRLTFLLSSKNNKVCNQFSLWKWIQLPKTYQDCTMISPTALLAHDFLILWLLDNINVCSFREREAFVQIIHLLESNIWTDKNAVFIYMYINTKT